MVYPRCCNQDEFDDEYESFGEFESEEATEPCPYCGIEIHEDADVCTYCGSFILDENRPSQPKWILWTVLILLALILGGFTCLL